MILVQSYNKSDRMLFQASHQLGRKKKKKLPTNLRRNAVMHPLVNVAGSDRAQSADHMTQTPLGHLVRKEHFGTSESVRPHY